MEFTLNGVNVPEWVTNNICYFLFTSNKVIIKVLP